MVKQNKKILLIDMDNVLCDFNKAYHESLYKNPDIKFPQSQYKFYENLEPICDSIESVNMLKNKYDVFILTKPSVYNPLSYTEKRCWIEKYLGFDMCEKLILACDKTMVKGDYLIDDNIHEGKFLPGWKLLKFGSEGYKDWNSIINYLYRNLNN